MAKKMSRKTRSAESRPDVPGGQLRPIRLGRLEIANYKGIDKLDIEFPAPSMPGDPDVFVLGSRNGVGKTALLECCALLLFPSEFYKYGFERLDHYGPYGDEFPINLPELLIRAGSEMASIKGDFEIDGQGYNNRLTLKRDGHISSESRIPREIVDLEMRHPLEMTESLLSLIGLNAEPLRLSSLMYFHSYRKVQEGSPELGMMVEGDPYLRRRSRSRRGISSTFKLEILRSMMSRGGLFEKLEDPREEYTVALEKLNGLMKRYAGGTIEKLRPSEDNTLEFRVTPEGGGSTFSFDGLSSGQKEIISTLFLIWGYTRRRPGIILIDEPELHLNVEWHREFVNDLFRIAPENQYMIATHSEEIFESVARDRRIMLAPDVASVQ